MTVEARVINEDIFRVSCYRNTRETCFGELEKAVVILK